jgi:hypothetical protein
LKVQKNIPSAIDSLLLPFSLDVENDLEIMPLNAIGSDKKARSRSVEKNPNLETGDIATVSDGTSSTVSPKDTPPFSELLATWETERQKQQNLISQSIGPKRAQDNSDVFRSETSMRWYQSLSQTVKGRQKSVFSGEPVTFHISISFTSEDLTMFQLPFLHAF